MSPLPQQPTLLDVIFSFLFAVVATYMAAMFVLSPHPLWVALIWAMLAIMAVWGGYTEARQLWGRRRG